MSNVIINADDFGYSDGVCRSVLELLDAEAVSGTSIMCAAIGASDRFRRWRASDLLGRAGIHLQLTGGRPLSPSEEVPTLVDTDSGDFRNPRSGELPDTRQVELEWRRQLDAAHAALGGPPTHLDSHHGVHRIPEFFDIYVQLAAELGVPVRGAAGTIGERMRSEGIPGSVALVRDWTGRSLGADSLRQMLAATVAAHPGERVVEIITHPGYNDGYLSAVSSLSAAREDDHQALLDLHEAGWPELDGHQLVAHSELLDPPARSVFAPR